MVNPHIANCTYYFLLDIVGCYEYMYELEDLLMYHRHELKYELDQYYKGKYLKIHDDTMNLLTITNVYYGSNGFTFIAADDRYTYSFNFYEFDGEVLERP